MGKGMLILVGSGRSGTVYMTGVLKAVYRFGFTGEPKFVYTWYRKYFRDLDYNDTAAIDGALRRVYQGRMFVHLRQAKKASTSFDDFRSEVLSAEPKTYEDFIEGIFRYVAEVRDADYPAYKDPLDVNYIAELAELLPNGTLPPHRARWPRCGFFSAADGLGSNEPIRGLEVLGQGCAQGQPRRSSSAP